MEQLPFFSYYRDPMATGSFRTSSVSCVACGRARGVIYVGSVFGDRAEEVDESICPWCLADGSAAERFGVSFASDEDAPSDVAAAVREELSRRTPCFIGFQSPQWLFHCSDAAVYDKTVGYDGLVATPADLAAVRAAEAGASWSDPSDLDAFVQALEADGSPTAHMFTCRHCGVRLAYSDTA